MTAAMTGLRRGELLALRWMDVDWVARKIRVRRNYVRGKFGTPNSKRSSRAVPLADRVARELDLLSRSSSYQEDEDLVFCHSHTGKPLDCGSSPSESPRSAVRRRGEQEARPEVHTGERERRDARWTGLFVAVKMWAWTQRRRSLLIVRHQPSSKLNLRRRAVTLRS